eukprot:scaffold8471_cov184-Amphora_coffeaeformis.AAC.3
MRKSSGSRNVSQERGHARAGGTCALESTFCVCTCGTANGPGRDCDIVARGQWYRDSPIVCWVGVMVVFVKEGKPVAVIIVVIVRTLTRQVDNGAHTGSLVFAEGKGPFVCLAE